MARVVDYNSEDTSTANNEFRETLVAAIHVSLHSYLKGCLE